jgi:hypothetical protein
MQINNSKTFQRLNTSEWELILYTLNVVYPGSTKVTQKNIIFYRMESLKRKLKKIKPFIKAEHVNMYRSIYEKLELSEVEEGRT